MKICLVAQQAYGAFTDEISGHIGGVERQTRLIAQYMHSLGHSVSVITWEPEFEPAVDMIDGIRIITQCKVSDGFPRLRFFWPRWSSLIHCLKEADADVYYQSRSQYITGQVALWCRRNRRKFIFSIASDSDCVSRPPHLGKPGERWLYLTGLRSATRVIAQTRNQQAALLTNHGVESSVLPMPGPALSAMPENIARDRFTARRILWIGRLHEEKRIEWMIDIARQLPDYAIEIAGPADPRNPYAARMQRDIAKLPNVSYLGRIPMSEVSAAYRRATILCCTSAREGFPNTFLEAWSFGVPVVTTFDPDGLVASEGLGLFASDRESLVNAIRRIFENETLWRECATRCMQYFRTNHEQSVAMSRYEKLFTEACDS